MSLERLVPTALGGIAVRCAGPETGPTAVLWPSLFVDARSWHRVEERLARRRRLVIVSGPGHGPSEDPGHRYSMEDCAGVAGEILDALDVTGPVDWVGNAWGGHVGIVFASTWPARCRSVVAMGAPVRALNRQERARTYLLLAGYRLFGAAAFIRSGVADVLLSPRTRSADPEAVRLVEDCLTAFDRRALVNAVVSISLHREDLTSMLRRLAVPTLFVTGREHGGWTPEEMSAAAALVSHASTAVVDDAAYLVPLEAPDETVRLVERFWAEQAAGSVA